MNQKAHSVLKKRDPLQLGEDAYDFEAGDVAAALETINDPTELAKVIQRVYERSFEIWIPFEKCVEIAYQLIAIKFEAKSII
ncbi:DUF1871 family protein [Ureibacillus sp. FSL K6-8385]|uniref:DUF1871 family protein n=1 Tax=Ureibacillus terrenus TaxID=118246 RepID=A0A540V0G4_9BACL|nr:DUF1871 family protein [Ureibacillus terrenus]MED3662910.1 DUF1871 family protein [Ureibacillus terrenus]MED3763785.1 DUF1871 family protein [Ureibacillus terrenus]TQE90239.1 DUF1871 family protein [Ureibacillus terrenus]